MKNRWSFWIGLFSGTFILFSLYWIIASCVVANSSLLNNLSSLYLMAFAFLVALGGIAAFFRKKWARKFIIILSFIGLVNMAVIIPATYRAIAIEEENILNEGDFEVTITKRTETGHLFGDFLDEFAEEVSQEICKALMKGLISETAMPIVRLYIGIAEGAAVLYLLLILFIYTRRGVKEIF